MDELSLTFEKQEPSKKGNPLMIKGGPSINPHGRGVGVRDKANQVKLAIIEVFEKTGGAEAMVAWIKAHPQNKKEFYKILVSLLPKDIDMKGDLNFDGDITITDKFREHTADIIRRLNIPIA